ncbi:MAG: hypothetical protein MUE35_06975, partial [Hydrogenophaga sp.]|nr:hypothetical protein [Hydrogenophaga sp.]
MDSFVHPAPIDADRRRWLLGVGLGVGALAVGGCASAPPTADESDRLARSAWARATELEGLAPAGPWT